MNAPRHPIPANRAARGFTLVELMVTIAIALFLLGGLVTIVQNVRVTYANQQALTQLQDQQRFAITLLTDVIQAGGYFDNPSFDTPATALPATGNFAAGQPFWGTQPGTATGDTIAVRFRTAQNDGIINCSGTTNTAFNPNHTYTNYFYVNGSNQLVCQLDNAAPVVLVNGVVSLTVFYGVTRTTPAATYNVDTYEQANAMQVPNDWMNVSSVLIRVTFQNPLANNRGSAVTQNPTIPFERVIQVMARAGDYT